jgi:hypothetical protein
VIEVIRDQYHLYPAAPGDLEITSDEQYDDCLETVRRRDDAGQSLRVLVRHPGMFHWFDHLEKRLGATVRTVTPKTELKRRLKQPLPAFLGDDRTIVDEGLIQLADDWPIALSETVSDWLYRVLLGDVWSRRDGFGGDELTRLLRWLWRTEPMERPFVREMMARRLDAWSAADGPYAGLLQWLAPDPFLRATYLKWERMLSRYPESEVAKWLQQEGIWGLLSELPERHALLADVPPPEDRALPAWLGNFVRHYLNARWAAGNQDAAIDAMSGGLDVEIDFLKGALLRQLQSAEPLESTVCEAVLPLSTNRPSLSGLVDLFRPVHPPVPLEPTATVADARAWIRSAYLPFYRFCGLFNRLDETREALEEFENWLRANYPTLVINGEGMAYRKVETLKPHLSDDRPVLIIVVDGLDYLTAEQALLPALGRAGLYSTTPPTPCFSFLPSETPIAKPALIGGHTPSQLPEEKATSAFYKELIRKRLGLGSKDIRSATDKEMRLDELVNAPARLYLYLDNRLDAQYLHAQLAPHARLRKYADYADEIARALGEAAIAIREYGGVSPLMVICSDHGYTELPKGAPVLPVDEPSKARSMSLGAGHSPPAEAWGLEPAELFGLRASMAIPRGYGCFGALPKGATHGGATPQEIAVPWIVASLEPAEAYSPGAAEGEASLLPIFIVINGAVHRRRLDNPVTLDVSNPNPVPVSVSKLEVVGQTVPVTLPMRIPARSVVPVEMIFDASDLSAAKAEITVQCAISAISGSREDAISLKVETTGAMGTEFDDDFDDFEV